MSEMMRSGFLRLFIIIAVVMGGAACFAPDPTSEHGTREPAGRKPKRTPEEQSFVDSCEKVRKDPKALKDFQHIALSDRGVGKAMNYIKDISKMLALDMATLKKESKTFDGVREESSEIDIKNFFVGIQAEEPFMWPQLNRFFNIVLSECDLARFGAPPTGNNKYYSENKTGMKAINKFCGKQDPREPTSAEVSSDDPDIKEKAIQLYKDFKKRGKNRTHPDFARQWYDVDFDSDVEINSEVMKINKVYNDSGALIPPSAFLDKCMNSEASKRINAVGEFLAGEKSMSTFVKNVKKHPEKYHEYLGKIILDYSGSKPFNIEDAIESLYLCLQSELFGFFEFNYKSGYFYTDQQGNRRPKPVSQDFNECMIGVSTYQIYLDEDGSPMGLDREHKEELARQQREAEKKLKDEAAAKKKAEDDAKAKAVADADSDSDSDSSPDTPDLVPDPDMTGVGTGLPKPKVTSTYSCLPGELGKGMCDHDSCVAGFSEMAKYNYLKLPVTFSAATLDKIYTDQKPNFVYNITKHQALNLVQGYTVMANQRPWKTAKAFRKNLLDFARSCGHADLQKELIAVLEKEFIVDPIELDEVDPTTQSQAILGTDDGGAPVPSTLTDQQEYQEGLGKKILDAVVQIQELREYVKLLKRDWGNGEVTTARVPKWDGIHFHVGGYTIDPPCINILTYFTGFDFGISFGRHTEYQCNMFSVMQGDDWVTRSSRLLTAADKTVRTRYANEESRYKAFCQVEGNCDQPYLFDYYLKSTEPSSFKQADDIMNNQCPDYAAELRALDLCADPAVKSCDAVSKGCSCSIVQSSGLPECDQLGPYKIKLRNWCDMRASAADSLRAKEAQLFITYPVLANTDTKNVPLFERIINPKTGSSISKTFLEYSVKAKSALTRAKTMRANAKTAEEIDDAVKKIELAEQGRAKLEKQIIDSIQDEMEKALPSMQEGLKPMLKTLCKDLKNNEMMSTYHALLYPEFLDGFEYCKMISSELQNVDGAPCEYYKRFITCKLQKEAHDKFGKAEGEKWAAEAFGLGMDMLGCVALIKAPGIASLKNIPKGIVYGAGIGAASYWITSSLLSGSQQWSSYDLTSARASASLALEGVDSYKKVLDAMSAMGPKFKLGDFVIGIMVGSLIGGKDPVGSKGSKGSKVGGALDAVEAIKQDAASRPNLSPEFTRELTTRLTEALEPATGGGHKFNSAKLIELEAWLKQQAQGDPNSPFEVIRNFFEQILKSESLYRSLVKGPYGEVTQKALRTMGMTWTKKAAMHFFEAWNAIKRIAKDKLRRKAKLTSAEKFIAKSEFTLSDLKNIAKGLQDRDLAYLAEALESALKEGAALSEKELKSLKGKSEGEIENARNVRKAKELSRVFQKLCGLSWFCTKFRVQGCGGL